VRDIGASSMYNLTLPDGHVIPGFSAFEVRAAACAVHNGIVSENYRLRPDQIDDVDLVHAINLLQQYGYDVQPAK